jgi:hypothetical protein
VNRDERQRTADTDGRLDVTTIGEELLGGHNANSALLLPGGLKPLAIFGDTFGVTKTTRCRSLVDPEGVTGNSQGFQPLV